MRRRALLAALSTTCVAGCLSDGGGSDGPTRSDRDETAGTETTAVGPDQTPTGTDDSQTLTPTEGAGTIRVGNDADVRAEVRVEIHDLDGDDGGFYRWILVDAGDTTAVSFSVDAPGDYRAVATLPDLGDREVNRTATTRWSVGSVDAPGTIVVTVTADSLRVTTE
ncbi:hypothetical protein [Halobaculum limi]|uniref:hypothetical protein n=1 Tax=Halobaculum limi TaxID=3031916 RepID=UPI0024056616|nr:hypothetical protein [Halobaculum sp. YSMS11]